MLNYVLITPARNEAQFIEQTIQCVVAQTFRPLKWIIVSDGSTDGTDEIIRRYAADHPWIELITMPERKERHFAGKVLAFNAGQAKFNSLDYDVIGNLDGDISFDEGFFAFLLQKLSEDPCLGLVGTRFIESSGETYDYRIVGTDHVSGQCQLFRRKCFEQIGGYMPVKGGGIDTIAVTATRMNGWKSRTFIEKVFTHNREMGTAKQGVLKARYRQGLKDYSFGNHPAWEFLRMFYQMTKRPYFLGGLFLGVAYAWALARRLERPIPPAMVDFRRHDQMQRLRALLTSAVLSFHRKPPSPQGTAH